MDVEPSPEEVLEMARNANLPTDSDEDKRKITEFINAMRKKQRTA